MNDMNLEKYVGTLLCIKTHRIYDLEFIKGKKYNCTISENIITIDNDVSTGSTIYLLEHFIPINEHRNHIIESI